MSDQIPAVPRRTTLPRFSDRLPLGGSRALSVSPFCIGMVADPEAIPYAFDRGVNFFFVTADMHWPLYEETRVGLARLLQRGADIRSRIVVASVSYCTQPEFCYAPHIELLGAVPGLDHLDVLVAGGAYGGEISVRAATYRRLLAGSHTGARAFGVTFHDREAAARALESDIADIVYIRYNPAHPRARQIVFPAVRHPTSAPLFGFKSTTGFLNDARLRELGLREHHWRPQVADYYRFALSSAEMDGVLCAPENPAQVDALEAALEKGPLSEREQAYLLDLAELDAGHARLRSRGNAPTAGVHDAEDIDAPASTFTPDEPRLVTPQEARPPVQ